MSTKQSLEFRIAQGYQHPSYAEALEEFGTPLHLVRSGGWVLRRKIDDSPHCDASGLYPFFSCRDWSKLHLDLEDLSEQAIAISLVCDPFGGYDTCYLQSYFDKFVNFKQHFVVDLAIPIPDFASSHHQRYARKALRELTVERCEPAEAYLDQWVSLYDNLVLRHHIDGVRAFSRQSFAKQLKVPGLVAFRASRDGETVGMLLWYAQDNSAYYHLGAYSPRGYELRASFALFHSSITSFAERGFKWLNLGGGSGIGASESGLGRFKKGWSTGVRPAYFCGRILDRQKYEEVLRMRPVALTEYFPAYRVGEFQ